MDFDNLKLLSDHPVLIKFYDPPCLYETVTASSSSYEVNLDKIENRISTIDWKYTT